MREAATRHWMAAVAAAGFLAVVGAILAGLSGLQSIGLILAGTSAVGVFGAWLMGHRAEALRDEWIEEQIGHVGELEESERRQRMALDELADGLDVMIFLTDTRTRILYANLRAVKAFKFDDPEGQSILAVTLSNEIVDLVQEVADGGMALSVETTLNHPEERNVVVQAWRETTADRVFVSIYDLTDLRRLERVRRDFVANVSHELRTPLSSVRLLAETLLDDTEHDLELSNRYLGRIIREVDRLSRITDDLLTLSRLDSGSISKTETDVAVLVSSVVSQLQPKAVGKSLILEYHGPGTLTGLVDEGQFTQLVLNLVDNAINYTTEGKVTVTLNSEASGFHLEVADTGIGLAKEHHTRIFERFYRVDKGRSRGSGGTGLGLSIVKNIAEAHGGRVSLASELGHGSTFTVEVPKD